MTIVFNRENGASEEQAIAELEREGFTAAVVALEPTTTETHQHDYDVCLHILEGELSFTDAEEAITYACRPGDKLFVSAGSPHHDSHGPLKIVVGRRVGGRPLQAGPTA